jgi:hypothetical protein
VRQPIEYAEPSEHGNRSATWIRTVTAVAVTLNQRSYGHAKKLIADGRFVLDDRDAWSEHRPPVRRPLCGGACRPVQVPGQYKYNDIEVAAAHLPGMHDAHR